MSESEKNTGEIRFEIALEIIYRLNLKAMGNSFLHCEMGVIAQYALTGEFNPKTTWQPSREDLAEIDYGKPKGIEMIKQLHEEERKRLYGAFSYGIPE